ncbi:MAG TPA: retroviral-like aspartic protease family protein [Myxococcota bacterium]
MLRRMAFTLLVGLPGLLGAVLAVGCASSTALPSSAPPSVSTPPVAVRVVDVRATPPSLTPWSPAFNARRIRGVVVDTPRALVGGRDDVDGATDDLHFVAVRDAGARGHVVVDGVIDGPARVAVDVVIDTAAERTVVAPALAQRLGLTPSGTHTIKDASGTDVDGGEVVLPDVVVAGVRFVGITAVVPTTALRDDLFLLGADALRHVDVVVDGPLGLLALPAAGAALCEAGVDVADDADDADDADVIELAVDARFSVSASAPGGNGIGTFDLVVDTGAPLTAVPVHVGLEAMLPADVAEKATLKGASGTVDERRGRFMLRPLSLGLVQVGAVSALEVGDDVGVLGNDVLGRGRVVISAARRALAFLPSRASRGPRLLAGRTAITVMRTAVDGDFLVDVSDAVGGARLLLRSHDRQTGAPRGGVVEVTIPGRYKAASRPGCLSGPAPFRTWCCRAPPTTASACA